MEISNYIKDRQNLESIYRRRKVDVVFSQQPIQPLATFVSGSQIQLVFQNSKHFLDLSKVQLFFRPVIQFQAENGLTLDQRAQLCMSPIDAQSMFTLQSVQINGAQICAQPQSNLQVTRSIFQGYWNNFISSKEKHGLDGDGDVFSSMSFGGMSGSTTYGLVENSITHPANGIFINNGYTASSLVPYNTAPQGNNQNSSQFEADPFPRAIVSRMKSYYPDFNIPPSDQPTYFGNEYYGQQVSSFADAVPETTMPASLNLLRFPLLALAVDQSTIVYKKQQELFQHVRMRFIQTTVTSYLLPTTASTGASKTLAINQNLGVLASNAGVTGTKYTTGDPDDIPPVPITAQNNTFVLPNNSTNPAQTVFAGCRMQYGTSVQNFQAGQAITRQAGVQWTSTNSTLRPTEMFTQMSVSLGELSCELRDIGLINMENTQIICQLQVNIPQNCISAYLQPGLLADPYNSYGANGVPTCYQQFLQACLIGNTTTLTITDTTCRIEYITYEDPESYQIMKALMYQPKPFVSIRQQFDIIPNSGIFTQRLSIGSSSIIQALVVMFPVANRNKLLTQSQVQRGGQFAKIALPQDAKLNFLGCQPPSDLRSTLYDSYYMNLAQIYAEVDGKRYASMDLNLSSPQLSAYLVTQAGLQTALNKYINVDLQSYLTNRFFYVIPINVTGSQAMRIQDQQIVITANIDDAPRVQNSQTFNELTQGINGQFGMLTWAITLQNLCDCSYVKL